MYVLRKSPLASMFCPISQTENEGSADIQKLGAESCEWTKWVFSEGFFIQLRNWAKT